MSSAAEQEAKERVAALNIRVGPLIGGGAPAEPSPSTQPMLGGAGSSFRRSSLTGMEILDAEAEDDDVERGVFNDLRRKVKVGERPASARSAPRPPAGAPPDRTSGGAMSARARFENRKAVRHSSAPKPGAVAAGASGSSQSGKRASG